MGARVPLFVGLDYPQASAQICIKNIKGTLPLMRQCINNWWAVVEDRG